MHSLVSFILPIISVLTITSFAAPTPDPSPSLNTTSSLNATNCWFCDPSTRNVFPFIAWENSHHPSIPITVAIHSLEQYKAKLLDLIYNNSFLASSPFRSLKIPIYDEQDSHLYQFFIVPRTRDRSVPPLTYAEAYGVVENLLSQIRRLASTRQVMRNLAFNIMAEMQDRSVVQLGGGGLRDASSPNGLQGEEAATA